MLYNFRNGLELNIKNWLFYIIYLYNIGNGTIHVYTMTITLGISIPLDVTSVVTSTFDLPSMNLSNLDCLAYIINVTIITRDSRPLTQRSQPACSLIRSTPLLSRNLPVQSQLGTLLQNTIVG